jgi:NAD(P)-dependent dehydrogenase (short-subunit alcohol dehydrogenase family)
MSVVLISGANSGIGQLSALAFARAGHQVLAGSRSIARADDLAELARAESLALTVIALDVTGEDSVQGAVRAAEAIYGPVDVLVNNAGIVAGGPVELVSDAAVRETFEINFFGPLRLIRQVLPSMRERGSGSIVLVGSLQGSVPAPGSGIYGASKHASMALNDALAIEVEQFGITVSCVEVGPYATGIQHKRSVEVPAPGAYAPLLAALGARGARRLAESSDPSEVADAIVGLAFHPNPPLRVPVGQHAERYLSADSTAERFRADLREELARNEPAFTAAP